MRFSLSAVLFAALCVSTLATRPAFGASKVSLIHAPKKSQVATYAELSIVEQEASTTGDDDDTTKDQIQIRGGASKVATTSSNLIENLTICFYFLAWYALNVIYNSEFVSWIHFMGFGRCFVTKQSH